jgi:hypothetical protein
MSNKFVVLLSILIAGFSGCVSPPREVPPVEIPVEVPVINTVRTELVFYGVSGVLSHREAAIQLALEDAARKLAIYHSVEGRFTSNLNIGARFFDYQSETEASIDFDPDYKRYVDNLIFDPETDVHTANNAVFVYARYVPPSPVQIDYPVSLSKGNTMPAWVLDTPEIPGYITGIGHAGRRGSHRDTVNSSYENAIYSILKNISTDVEGQTTNAQRDSGISYSATSSNAIRASGVLKGFYVLDFWVDPSTLAVWTFAVAKPGV